MRIVDIAASRSHVSLLKLYRRMCFHHICPDCIYSSCSEQVPKPSLLQTDGTNTLSSFFTSVPHREQTDGGMNNAEEMTSAERIDAMRAANQISEKMNI